MRIRVYRNLRNGLLSIQSKTSAGWRVTEHAESVHLEDAVFKVSEAGRQRVLRERRKNIHAYVEGERITTWPDPHLTTWKAPSNKTVYRVVYDPFKMKTFRMSTQNRSIEKAPYAFIHSTGTMFATKS